MFREEIAEGWVVIYMDNILVYSRDEETHKGHVNRMLEKLKKHKLSLKADKCT